MIILAVDPGKSTGIVVGKQTSDKEYEILHFAQKSHDSYIETISWLDMHIKEYKVDTVLTEQFDLRPGNKFIADLTPVKVNSVLEWKCYQYGITFKTQTPAQVKHLVKDEVLKKPGLVVDRKASRLSRRRRRKRRFQTPSTLRSVLPEVYSFVSRWLARWLASSWVLRSSTSLLYADRITDTSLVLAFVFSISTLLMPVLRSLKIFRSVETAPSKPVMNPLRAINNVTSMQAPLTV